MQSLLAGWGRSGALGLIVAGAMASWGCGGGKDALEKRVAGLQDELTRLQNSHDRVAERLQALELTGMRQAERAAKAPASGDAASAESDRMVRPPLKVIKVTPPGAPQAPSEEEAPPPEAEDAPRPVLRDHGTKPKPWMAPAKPAPAGPAGARAVDPRLGQTTPGTAPRGPRGI